MARVVVIGGGLGGLASAARLAKLGHQVTVLEQSDRLGGALCPLQQDGFTWDQGAHATLLPAALRDLFRKSGRPLESELELAPLPVIREHRFADGSRVGLPGGSRSAQLRAVDALGAGLGRAWVEYVDSLGADWDVLRRGYLEHPYAGPSASPEVAARLGSRESLHSRLKRLPDPRLRLLAAYPVVGHHHDARRVPNWMALSAYLEQRFGAWAPVGGMGTVADALARRLATRRVEVATATTVLDVVVRQGRAVGVHTQHGDLDAEVVVSAIDPHLLPALAAYVRKTRAVHPPGVTHLGLSGALDLPPQVVVHGVDDLTVRSTPTLAGRTSVSVIGNPTGDPLDALAAQGLDLRDRVLLRVDPPPAKQRGQAGSTPWGVQWEGRKTVSRRLGPTTPVPNVYAAGAHATPGEGIAFVALSAAQVAEAIGPA